MRAIITGSLPTVLITGPLPAVLDFISGGLLRCREKKLSLRAGLAVPEQTEPNLFWFLQSFVECDSPVSAVPTLRKP